MTDTIRDLGHGRFLVNDTARRRVAWATADAQASWVFLDGRVHRIPPHAPRPRHDARGSDDPSALAAPMPATVTAVHVAPGQLVSQGDTLLTLEAMKMELPICAPRDGKVKTIRCKAGDLVQPGVALVELDE